MTALSVGCLPLKPGTHKPHRRRWWHWLMGHRVLVYPGPDLNGPVSMLGGIHWFVARERDIKSLWHEAHSL